MKILLINANPVVSRLLALCTRDTHLILDEVRGVDEVKDIVYDLILVDDGSYVDAVDIFLEAGKIRKKIFISYVKETVKGFDETIQKPFLPSQITKVLESVDISEVVEESKEKHFIFPLASEEPSEEAGEAGEVGEVEKKAALSIFLPEAEEERPEEVLESSDEIFIEDEEAESSEALPLEVLDSNEIEKIKALLAMDDDETEVLDFLNEDEVHFRKVEVIKEQLISEGLEILDEDEIVNVLSSKTKAKKALKCKKNKLKHKKEQKNKQAMLHCSKEEFFQIERAVTKALVSLKASKMKKFLKGKTIELKIKLEDNN